MLELLINTYKDEYGYITNFNEIIFYLKENLYTIDQINNILLEINKHNLEIYDKIYSNNEEQKTLKNLISSKNENIIITTDNQQENEIDTAQTINDESTVDISYYKEQINNIPNNYLNNETIESEMPTIYNPNFNEIINILILEFKKELLNIIALKNETNETEFLNYIDEEIKRNKIITQELIAYRNSFKRNDKIIKNDKKINILFDTSTLADDLGTLDVSHYNDFYSLLDSLSNGILKGVKTFAADGATKKISELRNNQSRMLFEKIENNIYFIYYIFLKKDSDTYYRDKLINRANNFQIKKNNLVLKLFESSDSRKIFLEQSEVMYDSIMDTLIPSKIKKKGDQ